MLIFARFFAFFLFLSHCGMIVGDNTLTRQKKQMLSDLDFIANTFEISYAPATWKSEHYGWDLDEERMKAKNAVTECALLPPKAFQRIVINFCQSTKDYHVTPDFYSTERSTLPFGIKSAGGNYFISHVDEHVFLEYEVFPFTIGDQILSINGRPIHEIIDEFRLKEIGNNFINTDRALAEFYFTSRFGRLGHEVPKGTVEIIYRKAAAKEKREISLEWDYYSEKINGAKFPYLAKSLKHPFKRDLWKKKFMTPHCFNTRMYKSSNEDTAHLLGSRKSVLPELGTVLWETESENKFHAYLFVIDENTVGGYLRIPSYYVDDADSAAFEFAEIIELFEEVSDVLVIDQLNNGGGAVLYLYALLAMLTDRELELLKHRMILTQEDVYFAIERVDFLKSIKNDRAARKRLDATLEGFIVNYWLVQCFLNSCHFIIDQWNSGKLFTDYSYLYGIEKIIPHPEVRYTKPILVLVNSLNFSAADFFPAILQDNKRAQIMGERTAGAGGYIERISFPNLNGLEGIDITASFSVRPNGVPIENFGVTPDIPYEVSQRDLQNNYSEYKQNILKELKNLLLE